MNSNSSNGYIIINILSPVLKLFVQEERQMKEATSVMNPKSDDEQIGKWVGFHIQVVESYLFVNGGHTYKERIAQTKSTTFLKRLPAKLTLIRICRCFMLG